MHTNILDKAISNKQEQQLLTDNVDQALSNIALIYGLTLHSQFDSEWGYDFS